MACNVLVVSLSWLPAGGMLTLSSWTVPVAAQQEVLKEQVKTSPERPGESPPSWPTAWMQAKRFRSAFKGRTETLLLGIPLLPIEQFHPERMIELLQQFKVHYRPGQHL